MPVRPTLLHRMALLLFRKNLGNLREYFGQMVYRLPGKKLPVRLCPQKYYSLYINIPALWSSITHLPVCHALALKLTVLVKLHSEGHC